MVKFSHPCLWTMQISVHVQVRQQISYYIITNKAEIVVKFEVRKTGRIQLFLIKAVQHIIISRQLDPIILHLCSALKLQLLPPKKVIVMGNFFYCSTQLLMLFKFITIIFLNTFWINKFSCLVFIHFLFIFSFQFLVFSDFRLDTGMPYIFCT